MSLLLMLSFAALPTDTTWFRLELDFSQESVLGLQDARLQGILTLIERKTDSTGITLIRLDSLTISGQNLPASLRTGGSSAPLSWQGRQKAGRMLEAFQTDTRGQQTALLTPVLALLYPGFPSSIRPGTAWSDTTTTAPQGAPERTTIVDWQAVSIAGSSAVVQGKSRGEVSLTQASALGERLDRISMSGTRELAGPLAGPMQTVTASSVQQQSSSIAGGIPMEILTTTRVRITAINR